MQELVRKLKLVLVKKAMRKLEPLQKLQKLIQKRVQKLAQELVIKRVQELIP